MRLPDSSWWANVPIQWQSPPDFILLGIYLWVLCLLGITIVAVRIIAMVACAPGVPI